MVMCSVWKTPAVLGKHYIGYQQKSGRLRITWRDRIMKDFKDIGQMKAT